MNGKAVRCGGQFRQLGQLRAVYPAAPGVAGIGVGPGVVTAAAPCVLCKHHRIPSVVRGGVEFGIVAKQHGGGGQTGANRCGGAGAGAHIGMAVGTGNHHQRRLI